MSNDLFRPEHEVWRQTIKEFIENELAPNAEEWEEAREVPREIFKRMGELGYLGMRYPEEYGGGGGDILAEAIMHEEMPRCRSGGVAGDIGAHVAISMPHILHFGSDEQKEKYLVPGIKGEQIGCLAITESEAGSDVASIKTKAVRDGDDWVINGSKTFITNGARCDFMVLAAKTDPEKGYSGISMFVVDTNTPGFEVARKLDKLGWHASSTGELAFTDMRVPGDSLLGEENRGFYQIMKMFAWERLSMALGSVGAAQIYMDETLAYAKQRQVFGRPISGFQVIAHYFADMQTKIAAGRQLTYHALGLYLDGKDPVKEVSMAKLFCGRMVCEVVDTCLQIYGGYGYMEEYDISRAYRDVRLMPIGGGTDEIMREIICRMMGLG